MITWHDMLVKKRQHDLLSVIGTRVFTALWEKQNHSIQEKLVFVALGASIYSFMAFGFSGKEEFKFFWASLAPTTWGFILAPFTTDSAMIFRTLTIKWHFRASERRIRYVFCKHMWSKSHQQRMSVGVTLLAQQANIWFVVLASEDVMQYECNKFPSRNGVPRRGMFQIQGQIFYLALYGDSIFVFLWWRCRITRSCFSRHLLPSNALAWWINKQRFYCIRSSVFLASWWHLKRTSYWCGR